MLVPTINSETELRCAVCGSVMQGYVLKDENSEKYFCPGIAVTDFNTITERPKASIAEPFLFQTSRNTTRFSVWIECLDFERSSS